MESSIRRAALAGVAGSLATNVLHELVRRATKVAPRVDLLGMQALAKSTEALGGEAPRGRRLYLTTLAGDLASNAAYFAFAALGPRANGGRVALGGALGILAGVGAIALPGSLRLAPQTTSRTSATSALTVAIYGVGGLIAGLVAADR